MNAREVAEAHWNARSEGKAKRKGKGKPHPTVALDRCVVCGADVSDDGLATAGITTLPQCTPCNGEIATEWLLTALRRQWVTADAERRNVISAWAEWITGDHAKVTRAEATVS
jgi:hypothetical protein